MHIIVGLGSDAGWTDIDTNTGIATHHPGNEPQRGSFHDLKHVVTAIRHASEIKDPEIRQQTIRALGSSLHQVNQASGEPGGKSGIFTLGGGVIAIF